MTTTAKPRAASISILKGGVGKSTIAVNLVDRLATNDSSVLFIDLDPNGHASVGLGFKEAYQAEVDIGDILLNSDDTALEEAIYSTDFGFDILPSSNNLEMVEDQLRSASFADIRLRQNVIDPLLGERYDYIITDSPAYRGKLSDNALIATQNLILPLTPGHEALAGFERTMERQIAPIRQQIELEILALVPNRLSQAIHIQTDDRVLLEQLNREFPEYVPAFARITDDQFAKLDDGGSIKFKPGMRDRNAFTKAFGENKPLAHYAPNCDQIPCLDELAGIVQSGGVST
jgi:chromosome partitioning protein